MPPNYALRRTRKGTGLLPPNPKRWEQEHNALDLRHELALELDARLPHMAAYGLLGDVSVCSDTILPLKPQHVGHFSGHRSNKWSGMCIGIRVTTATRWLYTTAPIPIDGSGRRSWKSSFICGSNIGQID